jgi:hypothetical protein
MCEFQDELKAKILLLKNRNGSLVDPSNRRELSDITNDLTYIDDKNITGLSHEEIIKKYTNCLNQVIQRAPPPAGGKGRKRSYKHRKSSHSKRSKRSKRSSKKSKKNKRLILYGLD